MSKETSEQLVDDLEESRAPHRASDALFRLLVDTVEDYAIFVLDPTGRVSTWNTGAQRLKGYTAGQIVGRHFSVFYPDDEVLAGKCELELSTAAATGRFEEEGWRLRNDGSRFWANVTITALRSPSGALIGYGTVTRDLTERKLAQQSAVAAEARLGLLLESVRDYAIFMLDPDGRVASWNVGAQRIKGYDVSEIVGLHFSTFYPAEDVRAGKCEHELAVAAEVGRFEDEGWRIRKDGSRFWANVIISAVWGPDQTLLGFSKVTRDLTDRIQAEEARAARRIAEETNRAKDEFLAMLGHELRNPLAPIVTAIQLLQLRADTRMTREVQIIERQAGQMVRLVDDLLDVSRVARGKLVLQTARFELRSALTTAVEMAIPALDKQAQRLVVDIDPGPLLVDGDEARLVQVFVNLLNNASRYTPAGGHLALTVRQVDHAIVIEVSDDGVGIEPELLSRVFEPFVQAYQDIARTAGGLGIGLTLVRALVEQHQGTVSARSAGPGHGSTFTVRIPATQVSPSAPGVVEVQSPPSPAACRVLLVDDNQDAVNVLAEMLALLGHEVRTAADGPAALALLEAFTPDLAVLDIGLPGMDGVALATRIRALPQAAATRLVALSGYLSSAPRTGSVFDAHLMKPVKLQSLLDQITAARR